MKLKKCQENQIFQKIVAVQCLQIKVKTANYQIRHQTNLPQSTIRKITKLTKKEKHIKRKKMLKRLKKKNKKGKLIVKSKRVNKKCVNKTLNK
jgi:hypothetical protein